MTQLLKILLGFILLHMSTNIFAGDSDWNTAVSKHPADANRAIIFRFLAKQPNAAQKQLFSIRSVIVWNYVGENGMPDKDTQVAMNIFEDGLLRELDGSKAKLVLVSTGEDTREWILYLTDQKAVAAIDSEIAKLRARGLTVKHFAQQDPTWSSHSRFLEGLR